MGVIRSLYIFKVKVFIGAIKSSRSSMLLIALYVLGLLPASIGMSITIVNLVRSDFDLTIYTNIFATILSLILVFLIFMSFRGCIAYEYEQNIIFTSPVTPRVYLLASLLADITVSSIFLLPFFLFLGVLLVYLQLSIISTTLMIAGLSLFAVFAYFIKIFMSILVSLHRGFLIHAALILAAILLLLPAAEFATSFPIKYSQLPYPSTMLAEILLKTISGEFPDITAVSGIIMYFILSFILFLHYSKLNMFQCSKSIPFVSPFDISIRGQTVKTDQNIKFFSRVGTRFSLTLDASSIQNFLVKKEFIRMLRDGSFFVVLLFYVIVTIISILSRPNEAPFPIWIFLLSFYSFIVPAILVSNWKVVELDVLWLPLTAGITLKVVTKALLHAFTLVSFAVPAVTTVILTLFNNIEPVMPLVLVTSTSLIGSSTNLYAMTVFISKKRKATPTIMINYLAMFLSGLLISPTYTYAFISIMYGFDTLTKSLLALPVLSYSAAVFMILSKKIETKALNIET